LSHGAKVGGRFRRRVDLGLRNHLKEWNAGAVEVDKR
jgi:hypothetical protein